MALLSAIALALLSLVGYSAGVTLASRKQGFLPTILDLILVVLLWIIAFTLRSSLNRWLVLAVGLAIGLLMGFMATAIRLRNRDTSYVIPKSELPSHAREKAAENSGVGFLKKLWLRWNDFAGPMGNVQSRIIMGFFYFVIVTPFGLATRLFANPLNLKQPKTGSTWLQKEPTDQSVQSAREQG